MEGALTVEELKDLLEKGGITLIDVRSSESYSKEHIPGSINIPLDEIDKKLNLLDKSGLIVVYCQSSECPLSPKAYRKLRRLGYNVKDFAGGLEDWKKAGFPVESKS